jgi:hypothetical protein
MVKRLVSAIVMTLLLYAAFPGGSVATDKTAAPAKPAPPVVKVEKRGSSRSGRETRPSPMSSTPSASRPVSR